MRQTDTELHLARLQTELLTHSGGLTAEADIHRMLQQALRDLKGSVSACSLPEMAARLVAARLGSPALRELTPA